VGRAKFADDCTGSGCRFQAGAHKGAELMLAGMTVMALMMVAWPRPGFAQLSDDEYVRQALAAGPEAVAKNTAVVRWSRTEACKPFGKGLTSSRV
jgi:hypothetical protein